MAERKWRKRGEEDNMVEIEKRRRERGGEMKSIHEKYGRE